MEKCGYLECPWHVKQGKYCEGLTVGEKCSKFKPLMAQTEPVAEVPCSVGLSDAVVIKAINDEPEYPGEIPDKLWATLKEAILTDDKDLILFVFRQVVKDTKRGIRERLGR